MKVSEKYHVRAYGPDTEGEYASRTFCGAQRKPGVSIYAMTMDNFDGLRHLLKADCKKCIRLMRAASDSGRLRV
jgi:hypothetical protein